MKHPLIRRSLMLFALLLALLTLTVSFVSCQTIGADGESTPDQTSGEAPEGGESGSESESETAEVVETLRLISEGKSDFVIVRSEDASEEVISAAIDLQTSIKEKTGVQLPLKTDWVNDKAGFPEAPYEILIGNCDREAVQRIRKGVRTDDILITVSGKKIIVYGGSDEKTIEAVGLFLKSFVEVDKEFSEGELLSRTGVYQIESFYINDVSIAEYRIVYAQGKQQNYLEAANAFNARLSALTGITLDIVASDEGSTPYEIQLGDCNRGPSKGITDKGNLTYTLSSDGTAVAICATGSLVARFAVENILDQFFPAKDAVMDSFAVSLPKGTMVEKIQLSQNLAEGATMRIMSNNILSDSTLPDRAHLLIDLYLEYCPDIIGLQECGANGYTYVVEELTELYGVACRYIGSSNETSCYTPILYRKDMYELVDCNSFLYDSRWPLTNTKTLAWAVLRNIESGKLIAVINTHGSIIVGTYDTEKVFGKVYTNAVEGAQWREDNSRQIIETYNMLRERYGEDLTTFVMGDLNANVNAKSIQMLEEVFDNAINIATVSKTTGTASWHNVGKKPAVNGLPIDHILVTGASVSVKTHLIPLDQDILDSADHCPVICDVSLQ